MTGNDVKVNLDEWGRTLKDYVEFSSKTIETALNGKLRDLMFRCKDQTPMGMTRPEVLATINDLRAVAVSRLRKRHGNDFTREEIAVQMRRVGLGRGYMRSAWIKAAQRIPKNEASGYGTAPMSAAKFKGTNATVSLATVTTLAANAECTWVTQAGNDQGEKQAIASRAFGRALRESVEDMRDYMRQKLIKKAQKVSAK